MGAWGVDSFANDDALDWVAELEERGLPAVDAALGGVLELEDEYLEAPAACAAIAAAEVVAALAGHPATTLPPEVTEWVAAHRGGFQPELVALARRAVERIVAESELRELWAESEELGAWEVSVADLRSRLV